MNTEEQIDRKINTFTELYICIGVLSVNSRSCRAVRNANTRFIPPKQTLNEIQIKCVIEQCIKDVLIKHLRRLLGKFFAVKMIAIDLWSRLLHDVSGFFKYNELQCGSFRDTA